MTTVTAVSTNAERATRRPVDSRIWLLTIALLSTIAFASLYIIAVRTNLGQRLDASAVRGRVFLSPRKLRIAARLYTWVDISSIALLGGAIMLTAVVRDRLRLAFGSGCIIGASIVTAELLKHNLARPYLGVTDALKYTPTFPSGHTSVGMSLAIAALFVAPKRWRSIAGILGAGFASAVGISLVATASHRPSDVIGSALVVTGWAAVVARWLPRRDNVRETDRSTLRLLTPQMAVAGVILLVASFVAAAITIIAVHFGRVRTISFGREFVASSSAITGTILLCTAALLLALRHTDLDPPR